MTVARSDFFSCFIWLEFCMIISNDFLFICTISGMFSMTCRFMAFSSMGNSMKNAYSCCMSPLAHHIINAWHDSGPDLQSAPTPWMLVCLAPIGGSQLLLACFACLVVGSFLVLVFVWWWSLSPQVVFFVWFASRSRGSSELSSMCDTVVILYCTKLLGYCAVLSSFPRGSNLIYSAHRSRLSRAGKVWCFLSSYFPQRLLYYSSLPF